MTRTMADLVTSVRQLREFGPQQWAQVGVRFGPAIVAGLLALTLAWELARMTWLVVGGTGTAPPPDATPPAPMAAQAAPGNDLRRIVDAHLFGMATGEPGAVDVSQAPRTQMNLVLAGTLAGPDPRSGYAIVGESTATAKAYATGAVIRPGTRLHSVYTDRVILDNGGRLETLSLPRQSGGGTVMARPVPQPAAATNAGEELRRLAETNPDAFTSVVRPQPVFANGVQRGYRVYPGRDRRQFSRLGLQPGDLVTSINGTPLDDPARGMEIFNSLNSASQVNVTVERNGQTQALVLDTAQLSIPESGAAADAPQDAAGEPTTETAPATP